ncbi:HET-domain-containing protein [Hypoxylon crocopeplum]|nr:HET-domain-containing protein [Hypoxylon crocopeplum]
MALCLYCVSLQGTIFSEAAEKIAYDVARYPHQPSCAKLIESVEQGCALCRLILDSISRECRESGNLDADGQPIYQEDEISIGGVVGPAGQRWIWIGQSLNAAGALRAMEIPPDWKDAWGHEKGDINDAAIAMVDKWVRTCYTDHPDCSSQDKFMPTRLIEVGPEGAEKVRLITTAGLEPHNRSYIALSHCWGLNMPQCAKTLKEKLRDHHEGISLTDLTRTFVDTILIAKKLQVPFVWIDSLCIIQNSREDWEAEAAQMADVYSNAHVTLAASASSDGTQGCRIPNSGQEAVWPYVDIPVIGSRKQKRYRVFSWSRVGVRSLDNDALQTRGWTLQERELSPRIAHFSHDTMIWECRTLRASLSFPWRDPAAVIGYKRVFDPDSLGRKLPGPSQDVAGLNEEERLFAAAEWLRLVRLYSRRSLTKQEDALPAISGIARIFARFTLGAYCAGYFESHGIVSLLWVVNSPHDDKSVSKISCRPPRYTAPSWSWISVIGAVSWNWYLPRDKIENIATVQSIITTPAGTDPFGQLKDGSLQIRGKLRKLRAQRTEEAHGATTNPAGLALFTKVRGNESKVGWITFDVLDEVCESVYCLACARIEFPWPQVYGLGLVPLATDPSEHLYKRVGLVRTAERTWLEESLVTDIIII